MIEYHVHIRLEKILEMSDDELTNAFELAGKPLTPDQVRVMAEHYQAQGLLYLPVCDNRYPTGACAGHIVRDDPADFIDFERDEIFTDSPDVGPDCKCSRCGNPIAQGVPIRVFADDNREYRYHPECVKMIVAYDPDEEEVNAGP